MWKCMKQKKTWIFQPNLVDGMSMKIPCTVWDNSPHYLNRFFSRNIFDLNSDAYFVAYKHILFTRIYVRIGKYKIVNKCNLHMLEQTIHISRKQCDVLTFHNWIDEEKKGCVCVRSKTKKFYKYKIKLHIKSREIHFKRQVFKTPCHNTTNKNCTLLTCICMSRTAKRLNVQEL